MVIIGIDFGYARTGIAACDALEMLASPVETINESYMPKVAKRISEIYAARGAELAVVWLPLNMDGTCGEHGEASKELAELLAGLGLNVTLFDERLTTVEAYGLLTEASTFGKKRRAAVDKLSAVIILEDYIKSKNRPDGV